MTYLPDDRQARRSHETSFSERSPERSREGKTKYAGVFLEKFCRSGGMAYAAVSKTVVFTDVRVQLPPSAPVFPHNLPSHLCRNSKLI